MSRYFRITTPDQPEPIAITAAPGIEDAVARALSMLGAPSRADAADLYLPRRLLDTLRILHESGMAQTHRARTTATAARYALALAYDQTAAPRPAGEHDEAAIAETLLSVQRGDLNMSNPPPQRHVSYFTSQLHRAFAAAYQHGWNAGRRGLADLLHALDTERRAAPEPSNDRQRAAIAEARRIVAEAAP